MIDKELLRQKAIDFLEEEIQSLEKTSKAEHDLMKEAPSAMQSYSDTTRSQKEALLAGYGKSLKEKQDILRALKSLKLEPHETVKAGSLVQVAEKKETNFYFIIPGSSGQQIDDNDIKVTILSPVSVIARALMGSEEGDIVKVKVPVGSREMEIVSIE